MKSAIVTGAAKGLGREIALSLAREGYIVALNYNKSGRDAKATLRQLQNLNKNCIAVQGDLTKEQGVKKLIAKTKKKFGRIDILLNNIGDFLYKPLLSTSKKEFLQVIESNIITAFLCSTEVLPQMAKQRFGRIITIGSVGCDEFLAPNNTTPYYIAKTGLYLLTKALAKAAPKGVSINMVSLGILPTSIATPKDAKYTTFQEATAAIKKVIASNKNGSIATIAKWRPEG